MTTKTEVQQEIEKEFASLNELGFTCQYFDAGPEFGVTYKSKNRNRSIEIVLDAHEGGLMYCFIRRRHPKYFPFLHRDTDKKVFIDINSRFVADEELSALLSSMRSEPKKDIISKYAQFIQRKLYSIISGELWLE